jgi:uncharacterized protein
LDKGRRSFVKRMLLLGAGIFFLPSSAYGYASIVEPRWLQVQKLSLSFPGLPSAFRGIRVLQFSDIHFGFHYGLPELRKLVERIMSFEPDLICFTGDLVDRGLREDAQVIADVLSTISAPLGCFAVLGNHDYYRNGDEVGGILKKGGFRCLRNEAVAIVKGGQQIVVAGVEDMAKGRPSIRRAMQGTSDEQFIILLSHCPDYATAALGHAVDLQLSGHSHGGQVRIPGIGALVTPPFGRMYPDGLYQLGGGKMTLYTNRGIGVSQLPLRFMCRPELTIFTLE